MDNSPTLVPIYLEAKTKQELIKKMLENNLKFSARHQYFDIQKDGKKWIVWFYKMVELEEAFK